MPSIANEVITLVKDTSLVYVVGIGELLRAGKIASNRDASLLPLFLIGIIYLLLIGILTKIFNRLEKNIHIIIRRIKNDRNKNLEKSFKGNKILENISFTLKEGEILTLLGPSGAGKTTILRILNGLETCDFGDITLDSLKICEKGIYKDSKAQKEIHKNRTSISNLQSFSSYEYFRKLNFSSNAHSKPFPRRGY